MDSDEKVWLAFEANLINEHRSWPELSVPDKVCKRPTRKRLRTSASSSKSAFCLKPTKQTKLSTYFNASGKRKTKETQEEEKDNQDLLDWEQDEEDEDEGDSDVNEVDEVDNVNEDHEDVDEATLHQAEKEALAKIKDRETNEKSHQKIIDIALEQELKMMQEYIFADEQYELECFGTSSWTLKKISWEMNQLKKVFEVKFSSLLNPKLVKRFAEHVFIGPRERYLTSFLEKFANVA